MRFRRLGWAGVELEAGGATLVIDHLIDPGILVHFMTDERDALIEPPSGSASAALVTHLHRDHTDVEAIERVLAPDGVVLRPPRPHDFNEHDKITVGESEEAFAASSLDVRELTAGDTLTVGPFTATAMFASDGLGSPQVSWVIEAEGTRIYHAGDTLWHGAWWGAALAHGPFDLAFLPANGVEISYPHLQPAAKTAAVMNPEQAIDAAAALQAAKLVPIHYNRTFEHPDYYRPISDAEERIGAAAWDRNITVEFLEPGEWSESRIAA
ncbi:MAG: MBL fold metallo-hydrolase [Solirubrobacterales bacterium]